MTKGNGFVTVSGYFTWWGSMNGGLKGGINAEEKKNDGVNVPVKLSETQNKILDLIKTNPKITHKEISQSLNINEKTARRTLQFLRENGYIKREGSDKTGKWVILK